MSHKRVLELAHKFAETSLNDKHQAQRVRLETFTDNFTRKLRASLNEMEGDLFTLKEKGFDRKLWKEIGQFWRDLIEIYKHYDEKKPYESAKKLIEYLKSKGSWLVMVIPTVRKFLKENEVDFGASTVLQQARVEGFKKVIMLAQDTGIYMQKNPLLPDPRNAPTVPPPRRVEVIPDPDFKPVGPEAGTKVEKLVPPKKEAL
jgi:phosphoglycolate phosphatase-like HAD superfamily hydrolase